MQGNAWRYQTRSNSGFVIARTGALGDLIFARL